MSLSQSSNKRTRDLPIGVLVPSNEDDSSQSGDLYLFRDINHWKQQSPEVISAAGQAQDENYADNTVVCSVGIPLSISVVDFLSFVGSFDQFISHYRLIRETNPQSYMVLIKFRQSTAARDYYSSFNGRPFSSMEPETCSIYFVKSIRAESMLTPPFTFSHLSDESAAGLPTCSVCLEKMDEKMTSLLTILCQHTFHCYCLSRWGDGSCPICRYSSKPSSKEPSNAPLNTSELEEGTSDDRNHCLECLSTEGLWICLICGYIGCSNGNPSHAYDHYAKTSHPYALEIETQRVWDYAGNGYVHRLIQNVVDGKLVELPDNERGTPDGTSSESLPSREKLEAMSLEYTYLLTSQLDSQRMYYEDQLEEAMAQLSSLTQQIRVLSRDLETLDLRNQELKSLNSTAEAQKSSMRSSKKKLEQEMNHARKQLEEKRRELVKAKETNDELLSDISGLKQSQQQKQQTIKELGDQVRDLTFFLEARETVQSHPELEGGSVGTTSQQRPNTRKYRKKR